MKYFKNMEELNIFTYNDIKKIIGNDEATKRYINHMVKKEYIIRIKKNLYLFNKPNLYNSIDIRFLIGSRLNDDSFISYHSAFEFYGFYNQMYTEVQTSSIKRIKSFDYDGYRFVNYLTNSLLQVEVVQNVKVTSLERTIVDSINMIGKVIDLEELIKCLDLISYVNENKIIQMLNEYDKSILYKKVGYILSFYKTDYRLSNYFFELCKSKGVVNNIGFLINSDKDNSSFSSEWGLYAYDNVREIVNKGGNINV